MSDENGLMTALLEAQASGDPHAEAEALRPVARLSSKPDFTAGRSDLDRFLSRVVMGLSDCWVWYGGMTHLGYGALGQKIRGEHTAHRLAYRLFKGDIPDGLHVLHSCDVRCCVNPDHLRLGTHADNMRDMVERGRRRGGDVAGQRNGMAKLTAEQVAEIRTLKAEGVAQLSIARAFRVSPMTVSRIVRNEAWR